MPLTIEEFRPQQHIDAASAVLAARHVRDRAREPLLPAPYEVPAACRAQLQQLFDRPDAHGFVALDGDGVAGYMVGTPQLFPPTHYLASFFPPRSVAINYQAHAAREGIEHETYRELYRALAAYFVERGYFDHVVNVAPKHAEAGEAFASLGFGRHAVAAIRDVAPTARNAAEVEVHQAGPEDASVVYKLAEELNLHHARSPIYWPMLRETEASSHELTDGLLQSPANAHWIAYEDGRAVGMNTFMPPAWLAQMTVPDKTIYLYQGVVTEDARAGGVGTALLDRGAAWAREQGYEHIGLHFDAPNIQGARFWLSSGFVPFEYGLRRHIDERLAWANR